MTLSTNLDELKEVRTQLHNIFALLYQAKFEGSKSEAVFKALKFIDGMAGQVQKDIVALEPEVSKAPVAPVEAAVVTEPAVKA